MTGDDGAGKVTAGEDLYAIAEAVTVAGILVTVSVMPFIAIAMIGYAAWTGGPIVTTTADVFPLFIIGVVGWVVSVNILTGRLPR